MSGAAIVAFGAVSSQGEAEAAFHCGVVGAPARESIAHDDVLADAGLTRPFVARVALPASKKNPDRAIALLARALGDCASMLDRERPGWRELRVGLALGTSSGGMEAAEHLFRGAPLRDAREATYFGPLAPALTRAGLESMRFAPASLILGACASSTLALGIGTRWLAEDACDLVLAGGFDAVTVFVASGFEALRATTSALPPRPFRMERDGMALGEGAGVVALVATDSELADPRIRKPYGAIGGFGASADAVHVTAPDRTGAGLAAAVTRALDDARISGDAVDLISAHATATPFNDPAEWRAVKATLRDRASSVPVHPFKAQIGHTLGAAGVLESLSCFDAFQRGVLPAAAGHGTLDPDAPALLLERTVAAAAPPRVAIKLSSAFGGANAALVLRDTPIDGSAQRPPRQLFPAYVTPAVVVDQVPDLAALAAATRASPANLSRSDALVRLALAALARLAAAQGSLAGAGIVVGQAFATLETNALYFERILARGARFAEGRRFPYTSPNAVAGECGVAFGLTGPAFAVGAGLHAGVEALAIAAQLVRAGDADRMVAIAVDDVGPTVTRLLGDPFFAGVELTSGATAVLVSRAPQGAAWRAEKITLERSAEARRPLAVGHRGLLPLLDSGFAGEVQSSCPSGGFASIGLFRV